MAGGALRWFVHGEVVGFCGGEVVGEATERDGWEKVVLRVRGEVVKFVS